MMILDLIGDATGFSVWTRMSDTGDRLMTAEEALSERPRETMLSLTFADGSEIDQTLPDDHIIREAILDRWAELDEKNA